MAKKNNRVFGMFFVITENGVEKATVNTQEVMEKQAKLLREIKEKNEGVKINIPKEIKKEIIKSIQKFLNEE